MLRYPIVIEQGENNFSAYAPDVPGCIATGKTVEETSRNMADALTFHLQELRADGEAIPEPAELVAFVEVAVQPASESSVA